MKLNKKLKILLIICLCCFIIPVGGFVCTVIFDVPGIINKKIMVTVDNSYRNCKRNYSSDVIGTKDNTLFMYCNHLFRSGIYEINSKGNKRVYKTEYSVVGNNFFGSYAFNGKIVEAKNGVVCSFNLSNGEYEPYLDCPLKDGEKLKDIFTIQNELYYIDSSNNIYHYIDSETLDIAASKEIIGEDFIPLDFCCDIMYYSLTSEQTEKNIPNDYAKEYTGGYVDDLTDCGVRKIYEYNLTKRKTQRCFDFSGLEDLLPEKNYALKKYLVAENQVYLFVDEYVDLEKHFSKKTISNDPMLRDIGYATETTVYRYDANNNKYEKLMEFNDGGYEVNGYGDKVYVVLSLVQYGDNGGEWTLGNDIYSFSPDLDKPTFMINADEVYGTYIFDDEWLYYDNFLGELYRVRPDGSGNERII